MDPNKTFLELESKFSNKMAFIPSTHYLFLILLPGSSKVNIIPTTLALISLFSRESLTIFGDIIDILHCVSIRCTAYRFDRFILQYDCHCRASQYLYCVT